MHVQAALFIFSAMIDSMHAVYVPYMHACVYVYVRLSHCLLTEQDEESVSLSDGAFILLFEMVGCWGMAQCVKHLLRKHEDLCSDPRKSLKALQHASIIPALLLQDGRQRQENSQSSQACLSYVRSGKQPPTLFQTCLF